MRQHTIETILMPIFTALAAVLFIALVSISAHANELERGDLKAVSLEASLEQTNALAALKLELNKITLDATLVAEQD